MNAEAIRDALSALALSEQIKPASDYVSSLTFSGDEVSIVFSFDYPCFSLFNEYAETVNRALVGVIGNCDLNLDFIIDIPVAAISNAAPIVADVKNVILVASGKGGVGKSTTSVNLALALASEGARCGILDADIYGPSIPTMLGVASGSRPRVHEDKAFEPIVAHGLQTMSLGYLTTDKTPAVWRGPMASSALMQMMNQTRWEDLDYLIVDMPPGTGDIQLTMAQKIAVSAAVIVSTPQTIALLDAQKAVEMFAKVHTPVVGLIENMSYHICSQCGHNDPVFGSEGGVKLAQEYGVSLLGQLPLNAEIRVAADEGEGLMSGELGDTYKAIARKFARELLNLPKATLPQFEVLDD